MKAVIALKIEDGHPMPQGRRVPDSNLSRLRETLRRMKVGQSFLYDRNDRHYYAAAQMVGCKITVAKQNGGGCRVWKKTECKPKK